MNILIGGSSPSETNNRGDEAVFNTFCEGMRREFPGCGITSLVRHPNAEWDRLFDVKSIRNFDHETREQSLGRIFNGFNPGDPDDILRVMRQALQESDLVVIGGSPFEEIAENSFLRGEAYYSGLLALFAIFFQKPFVIYGMKQSVIKKELTKNIAKFVCENAKVVTLREESSRERLVEAGISDSNVHVLVDPAFGVSPVFEMENAKAVLQKEGIELGAKPVIGVTFRHMYWMWKGDDFHLNTQKMADLCDYVIEQFGAQILFIPNQCYNIDTPKQDDRFSHQKVHEGMRNKKDAFLIQGDYRLPDTLALFQLLDMVIANRRHTCVFAALHNTPMVALNMGNPWNFLPILDTLSIPEVMMNFVDAPLADLKTGIKQIYDNAAASKKTLAAKLPEHQQKAHEHTKIISEAYRGRFNEPSTQNRFMRLQKVG